MQKNRERDKSAGIKSARIRPKKLVMIAEEGMGVPSRRARNTKRSPFRGSMTIRYEFKSDSNL